MPLSVLSALNCLWRLSTYVGMNRWRFSRNWCGRCRENRKKVTDLTSCRRIEFLLQLRVIVCPWSVLQPAPSSNTLYNLHSYFYRHARIYDQWQFITNQTYNVGKHRRVNIRKAQRICQLKSQPVSYSDDIFCLLTVSNWSKRSRKVWLEQYFATLIVFDKISIVFTLSYNKLSYENTLKCL